MTQYIIFGCGKIGEEVYHRFENSFSVYAWCDNNGSLWGGEKFNIPILSPEQVQEAYIHNKVKIIIAIHDVIRSEEVSIQLRSMGIKEFYVFKDGFIYNCANAVMLIPVQFEMEVFKKHTQTKCVLLVQTEACIRTHKIAKALKLAGNRVFLAYLFTSSAETNSEYLNVYEKIFPINSMKGLIDFVNDSDFDLVHSSNEPDYLTLLLSKTNKTVIHDCHDLSSSYKSVTPEELVVEHLANTLSDGVIFTTDGVRNDAVKKFNIPMEKTFVLENLISEDLRPTERHEKLSKTDNMLHCVYEGGVVPGDKESHRYFEEIWVRIAEAGIHIHFYTNCNQEYCHYLESLHQNIHYEGNRTSKELANEMTKYDVGLCILNVTEKNRRYLEFASPNKIQEYVNAGIPVAVGDIDSLKQYVEKNGFGKQINFGQNIAAQLSEISNILIPDNILHEKGLTLESRIPMLLDFYERVKLKCRK